MTGSGLRLSYSLAWLRQGRRKYLLWSHWRYKKCYEPVAFQQSGASTFFDTTYITAFFSTYFGQNSVQLRIPRSKKRLPISLFRMKMKRYRSMRDKSWICELVVPLLGFRRNSSRSSCYMFSLRSHNIFLFIYLFFLLLIRENTEISTAPWFPTDRVKRRRLDSVLNDMTVSNRLPQSLSGRCRFLLFNDVIVVTQLFQLKTKVGESVLQLEWERVRMFEKDVAQMFLNVVKNRKSAKYVALM